MNQVTSVTGTAVPLLLDDIDTDRIIPARFLRCVTFDGLGEHAFEDDRKQDPKHPFDNPSYTGASILVAGRNFGCGSSREHAPQSLIRWGIKAIVGESFAEIFFGNCVGLGVPCVNAARSDLDQLSALIQSNPKVTVTVDLNENRVRAGNLNFATTILDSARASLTTGKWDFLGQLLEGTESVKKTAQTLPYLNSFKS